MSDLTANAATLEGQELPEPTPQSPIQILRDKFSNAPTEAQLNAIKSQAPGGGLLVYVSPDNKRGYIMRGISALELQTIQEGKVRTAVPERQESETAIEAVSKCCVWTNTTNTMKLTELDIKGSGAGLVDTLYRLVSYLSDFVSPDVLPGLVAEL